MSEVVIVSAKRTATGTFLGSLSDHSAAEPGSRIIRALLEDLDVKIGEISQVIMGQALTAGCGQNPARQAALNAGLPVTTQCLTINKEGLWIYCYGKRTAGSDLTGRVC